MNSIVIKNETLPLRCDICHQVDYFDPQTNYCSRCQNSSGKQGVPPSYNQASQHISDKVSPQTFRSNALFTVSLSLIPWLLLFVYIVGYQLAIHAGFYSGMSWLIKLCLLSLISFPVCGLAAVIAGHLTRKSIKEANIKPTKRINLVTKVGLVGGYVNLTLAVLGVILIIWVITTLRIC